MTLTQIRFEDRDNVLHNVYTEQLDGNVVRAYADVRFHSSVIWILSENPLKTAEHVSRILQMPFQHAGENGIDYINFFAMPLGGIEILFDCPDSHDVFLAKGNHNA